MKKIIIILAIFGILAGTHNVLAAESITSFVANINVTSEAKLEITERISYDFGTESKHGIYRDIPFKYSANGGNYNLKLEVLAVTDDQGRSVPFSVSSSGRNQRIRIGDPDQLVSGTKEYVVSYTVERAIVYQQDYDELYWNVTGNDWLVPIQFVQTTISLPNNSLLTLENVTVKCFQGIYGSTDVCNQKPTIKFNQSGQLTVYSTESDLPAQAGVTLAIQWPKGVVQEPTQVEKTASFVSDNWFIVLPLIVFIAMFIVWRKHGKDTPGRGVIIPEYDPPKDLTPAEVGTIVDDSIQTRDIVSEIIYLAVLGYLKIERVEEKKFLTKQVDYRLIKQKDGGSNLTYFENRLLTDLFATSQETGVVLLSELRNKFFATIKIIKADIYSSLVAKKIYHGRPDLIRTIYLTPAILIVVAGVYVFTLMPMFGLCILVSGLFMGLFAWLMPKRTNIGALVKDQILGFKMYLTVAEKDRLKFHNAPEKRPETFEKFLPFAIALGVEKQWAEQFKDIALEQPQWYQSNVPITNFSAAVLVSDLNSFSHSAGTSLGTAPTSGSGAGGGGFSGGGFGGGGGGSW